MKIEVKTGADGTTEVMLSEVYSGVGIQTAVGLFGVAERDGGIEVLLDGKTVWARGEPDGLPATLPPPPQMTEQEAASVTKAVDKIRHMVGPLLRGEPNFAAAVALTGMAAHHALHDDATLEDFLDLCRMAWEKSAKTHADGCRGKN